MIRKEINTLKCSSCGRFFDAVSSLLGLRNWIAYEGQAAMELDMCQEKDEKGQYPFSIVKEDDHRIIVTSDIIRSVVDDIMRGVGRGVISSRFHNTLIEVFTAACMDIRDDTGIRQVALSGGSFQNATLLTGLARGLASKGFSVYTHSLVPTNDGSLALGQAVCVGLRYRGVVGAYEGK